MCGVVLAVVSESASANQRLYARRDIHAAMLAMDARGGDSWGIGYTDDPTMLAVTHGAGRYASQGVTRIPVLAQGALFVGHTRFATRGDVCHQNAHPFRHLQGAWAHNGSYSLPHAEEGPHETVDSYYLTRHIAEAADKWADRALAHSGYGTVVGIDADTMSAYVWQSGGSHEIYHMAWGTLITSSPVKCGVKYGRKGANLDYEILYLVTPRECAATGVSITLHKRDYVPLQGWYKGYWLEANPTWGKASSVSRETYSPPVRVKDEWTTCVQCGEAYQGEHDYICDACDAANEAVGT